MLLCSEVYKLLRQPMKIANKKLLAGACMALCLALPYLQMITMIYERLL